MSYEPTVWVDGDHVTSAKLNKLEQGVNSMSYTPTVWNAGDVVTAEKLNKLEQGVAEGGGGGATFPTFTASGGHASCDMTFAEINANYQASDMGQWGIAVFVHPVHGKKWVGITLVSGFSLDNYEDVPETVSEGFKLLPIGETEPIALYADDDNFYIPKE